MTEQKIEQTKATRIGRVYDLVKQTITLNVPGVSESLVLYMDKVSPENRTYAAYHGFGQRIGDSAAMERATRGGKSATALEKFNAMKELVEHYNSGAEAWSPKRADRISSDELLLAQALQELFPNKAPERIREYLAERSSAERTALRSREDIKPIIDRLLQEQVAASAVNTDDLLAAL